MPFIKTGFEGLHIYEPNVFEDNRGYFFESYNEQAFIKEGIHTKFVQDNQARSDYGVIRGLHYQLNPYAQTKLIRVLSGSIWDVVVDIRKGSSTYGQNYSIELSAKNKKQFFIPAGFAHGYSVISETAEVFYKCDQFWNKEAEGGVLYKDPALDIDWKIPENKQIVSEKDTLYPVLSNISHNFIYKS
ncbi:MAG: dTDP-4-dehydrorhamnose 3,5-epimerase [Ferruginibacter sp.]